MTDSFYKASQLRGIGLIGLALGLCAATAQAQNISAHEQLSAAVSEYVESFFSAEELQGSVGRSAEDVGRRVEIDISRIDPRLPLSQCEQPLIASMNQTQRPVGRINVKVECFGSAPWTKYVPVNVQVYEPVLITTRPLARGEVLSQADLSFEESDVSLLRGSYLQSPELALGMEVQR